jgi:hypothetical protein
MRLKSAADRHDALLWCGAAVKPVQSLGPLWERIESARSINQEIPQVIAAAFGLNLRSAIDRRFPDVYYRLASETRAFCGPWSNSNNTPLEVAAESRKDGTVRTSGSAWTPARSDGGHRDRVEAGDETDAGTQESGWRRARISGVVSGQCGARRYDAGT